MIYISMKKEIQHYSCSKCGHGAHTAGEIRVAGSFLTQAFNMQKEKYATITCNTCQYTEFYKIKKGKQERYLKDEKEKSDYLLQEAINEASIFVNKSAPAISGVALEKIVAKYYKIAATIEKLGKKYNKDLLGAIVGMSNLSAPGNTKETTKWCNDLQKKLNKNKLMSETHKVIFKDKEVLYSLEVYGVVVTTSALGTAFFGSTDYKKIQKYSDEVESIFSASSFVQKGQKETKVACFADAIEFLLKEAQKGQGFQRYKGLGEMNPDQLWDTTMNPESRTLLKVKVEDAIAADEVFSTLMGDEVEPRRNFIEDNALKVENLDY